MKESNPHIEAYRQEAEELLAEIEQIVLELEENPGDQEALNHLFRAVHTIKGSGAMFGFDDVAEFTHHLETVLDTVREGKTPVTKFLIDLVLASRDQVKLMLDAAAAGEEPDSGSTEKIISGLKSLLAEEEEEAGEPVHQAEEPPAPPEEQGDEKTFRIRFRPHSDIFSSGMDPAMLLEELKELGECDVVAYTEEIPGLEDLNPEHCHIYWDAILTADRGIDAIRDVFIFVEGESSVDIQEFSEDNGEVPRIGEILTEKGDITPDKIQKALGRQKKIGELLVDEGMISGEKVKAALVEQKSIKKKSTESRARSVRVPAEKLDNLVNIVGELVISQARLSQVAGVLNSAELSGPVEEIERLTAELRDNALDMRMMPIGTTFSKFRRLVRDLSSQLGKEAELVTEGAETELDKTVIERLDDPLVHLIRNSIDHGIELPAEREGAGKPIKGAIRLTAKHVGASVLIQISDDGAGMDPAAIRAKAVEKGLISPEAELSEGEIFSQIFEPGFSTAGDVTGVSGRGVGMDVVKRGIEALRGTVELNSRKGFGVTVTLKLPLTLAIIEGLLVKVGKTYFVLPLGSVKECVEVSDKAAEKARERNMLDVRGKIITYQSLRDLFGLDGDRPDIERVVVAEAGEETIGFGVDHVIGQYQTVIKSLGNAYRAVKGFSGATIMGDGTVALILDLSDLASIGGRKIKNIPKNGGAG